ncbi:MAG: bifunctional riboflavin kinase/FAD synthetase [Thermoleophilia bacterium]
MRIYRSLAEIVDLRGRPRAVAIGTFDGVHRGHQSIIAKAVQAAREMGGVATVLTFEPHPAVVLRPETPPLLLTPLELKIRLLEQAAVDEVVAVPFDRDFAALSPAAFCRLLLSERLGARQVMVGQNFRFGHHGAGTPEDLLAFGQEHGFSVTAIGLLRDGEEPVSSTRIRALIVEGAVEAAAGLLGRPHVLEGYVVAGAGRGRDLGTPTANLAVSPLVAVPAEGVYVTRTVLPSGRVEASVTSVGTNPTFESDALLRVETYLLRFKGSLYGESIRVEFLQRLRGQRAFPDATTLVAQIERDVREAEAYFRAHP